MRDLDAARETFTGIGFTLAPRGLHSTGSSNHNATLRHDYFELLQVPQANPLQACYHEFLRHQDGLVALALTGTDVQAALPALTRKGFGNKINALDSTMYGLMLVLFIIYMPSGILGKMFEKMRRAKA